MSVVLQTGVMYYRESQSDDWHPLILKVDMDLSVLIEDYSQRTWELGEYCRYASAIYRCTTPITTPEVWDSTHWQETTIGEELKNITDITGDGDLDSSFMASDLTGAANELKTAVDSNASDIDDLEDIAGNGQLSGFTATDLTGAANELKTALDSITPFDTTPTANSAKGVTSGGVKTALDNTIIKNPSTEYQTIENQTADGATTLRVKRGNNPDYYAQIKADGEGGNLRLNRPNGHLEIDGSTLNGDGTGRARLYLGDSTTELTKQFQFKEDGSFVDGNNVSTTTLNTTLGQYGKNLAIYTTGDTAPKSIAKGKFVMWKGNLYKANQAISGRAALSTSNLDLVQYGNASGPEGALNILRNALGVSNDYIATNIAGVKTQLETLANNLEQGESQLVRLVHTNNSETTPMKPHLRYEGYLYRTYNSPKEFTWLASNRSGDVVCFGYSNGTWTTKELSSIMYIDVTTSNNNWSAVPSPVTKDNYISAVCTSHDDVTVVTLLDDGKAPHIGVKKAFDMTNAAAANYTVRVWYRV